MWMALCTDWEPWTTVKSWKEASLWTSQWSGGWTGRIHSKDFSSGGDLKEEGKGRGWKN